MPLFDSSDGDSVPVESDDAYADFDSVPSGRLPSEAANDNRSNTNTTSDPSSDDDNESLARPFPVVDPPGQYNSNRFMGNRDPPGRRYSHSRRSEPEVEDTANLRPAALTTTTALLPLRSILLPEWNWSAVVAAAATRPAYYWMRDDRNGPYYGTEDDDSWSDGEARENNSENDRFATGKHTVTVLEWGDSDNDDDDDDCKPPPGHVFPQIEGEPWKYNGDTDDDDDYGSLFAALAAGRYTDGS